MREKVGKARNTVFFQWFGAPEGQKVGSLKRRVQSQLARWEMKNLQVKMYKTHQVRTTFGSWDAAKRRCGAKHISKSKCTKHFSLGPLLKVEMSKKCTPLWREAHSKSTSTKHTTFGPLLEVEMSKKCTPLWREAHFQVKMYKTLGVRSSNHFWRFRCRTSARSCGANHISKSKC